MCASTFLKGAKETRVGSLEEGLHGQQRNRVWEVLLYESVSSEPREQPWLRPESGKIVPEILPYPVT